MKKFLPTILIISLTIFSISCTKKQAKQDTDNQYKIGIAKVISHPALDDVEKGISDELSSKGIKVDYDYQNANGDINTAASIATKFKSDNVDIMVGIGTPIAVALVNAEKNIPIVFSAITDPVSAGLVENLEKGYKNVTGAVDTIPIEAQITEFRKIYPFKKLGFIYTSSESNSVSMAETTKQVCDKLGIELIQSTISNASEVKQAAESLVGRVDAFYTVSDNSLMAGLNALTSTALQNKIPVFGADTTSAKEGGSLYVMGFDYYNLGRATGNIIIEILNGKKPEEIPVFSLTNPKDYETLIDLDVAKKLNINIHKELIDKATFIIENGKLTEIKHK